MEGNDVERKELNKLLFCLGFIGILSLLFLPIEVTRITARLSEEQMKIGVLLNPSFLLLLALVIGYKTAPKVGLACPILLSIIRKDEIHKIISAVIEYIKKGAILGFILAIFITIFSILLNNHHRITNISDEVSDLAITNSLSLPLITRLLYGGITEEIIMRWGVMSLFVFVFSKIFSFKKFRNFAFWLGIIFSAIMFGIGHLPITSKLTENIDFFIILYIIIGNSFFGIFAGYFFWKKGLECAIFIHVFFHIFIYLINYFLSQ